MGLLFSKQNEDLQEIKRLTEFIREQKDMIQNLRIKNLSLQKEITDTLKETDQDVEELNAIIDSLRASHDRVNHSHIVCFEVIAKLIKEELAVSRPSFTDLTEVESEVDKQSESQQALSQLPVLDQIEA